MAVQERKAETTLDRYIAEVRSVWGDGKDPQLPFKVKAAMEKLFASTSPDDPWMAELIREGKPSRELYRDPQHGFIQMGHVHKQGHGNTPHDHGPCWVVYGAYSGLTEITKYQRTDDGSQPGKATLAKERLDALAAGTVALMIVSVPDVRTQGISKEFSCPACSPPSSSAMSSFPIASLSRRCANTAPTTAAPTTGILVISACWRIPARGS
jgi:hypothetical protein